MFRRPVSLIIIIAFMVTSLSVPSQANAQGLLGLPEPGSMVLTSAAFQPVMLKGLTVHKDNPFLFDFIVDMGQEKIQGDALKAQGDKLIKYFMATLAIPEKDLWVNLSPYEKDRTIPEALGQTDMGRDLLAQDYILKQLTASLIYPEKELGKKFWDKVYTQMQAQYGKTVNIPVNTFNKVWIMADKAEVFERNQTALVTSSHLKVMLEEDYLAAQRHAAGPASEQSILSSRHPSPGGVAEPRTTLPLAARTKQPASESPALASQVIKEIILPAIEREVNEGQNFASLRQIFNSIILASWYKNNLKDSLLNEAYSNKATVKGIDLTDKTIKQQIYERYLQAYKKGVFNYIKDEPAHGTQVPRKYFSGGIVAQLTLGKANEAMAAAEIRRNSSQYVRMVASLDPAQRPTADAAMKAADIDALVRTRNVKEIVQELKILNGVTRFDFDGVRDLAERIAQDDQLYAQVFAAMDASKKKHAPGAGEISRDNSILEALQQARILNNTGLNRASLNIAQEEARKALSLSANQKLIVDTKSIATVLSNIFHQDMKTGEKPGKVFVKEAQGNVVPLNKASEALSRILNTRGLVPLIIFSAENGYSPKKAYLAFLPKADNAMSAAPSFAPIYQEMIKNLQQPKGNTIAITSLLLQSKDKTNPKPAFMQGMLDGSLGLPLGAGYMLGQNWQLYPDSPERPNNRRIVLGWAKARLDEANGIDLRQGQEMGINGDREKIRAFLFDVVQSSNTVTLYINGKPYFKAQDRDDIIILPDVFLNAVAKLGAVTFHVKAWRDNLKWAVDISTEPQGVKDQAMTADEAHQLFDQAGVKKAFETMGRITNNGLFVEDGKIKWAWDVNVNLADEALREQRLVRVRDIVVRFVQVYSNEYDITVDVPKKTDMQREDIVTFYIAKKNADAAMLTVEQLQETITDVYAAHGYKNLQAKNALPALRAISEEMVVDRAEPDVDQYGKTYEGWQMIRFERAYSRDIENNTARFTLFDLVNHLHDVFDKEGVSFGSMIYDNKFFIAWSSTDLEVTKRIVKEAQEWLIARETAIAKYPVIERSLVLKDAVAKEVLAEGVVKKLVLQPNGTLRLEVSRQLDPYSTEALKRILDSAMVNGVKIPYQRVVTFDAAMTHVEVKQLLDAGKLDEVLNEYLSYFKQYSQKNRQRLLEMTDTIVTHPLFENSMFEEALDKAAEVADRFSKYVYEDAIEYMRNRRSVYDRFRFGEAPDDFKINWEATRPSKEETVNLQRMQLQTLRAIAAAVLESKWYGGSQIVVTDGNILLAKFLEGLLRNVSHTLEFDKEGKEARISILNKQERQRFEQEAIRDLTEQEGAIAFYGSRIAKAQVIQEKLTAALAPEELSAVRLSLSRTGQISIIVPFNEALKEKIASLLKDNVTQVAWHRIPDVVVVSDAAMKAIPYELRSKVVGYTIGSLLGRNRGKLVTKGDDVVWSEKFVGLDNVTLIVSMNENGNWSIRYVKRHAKAGVDEQQQRMDYVEAAWDQSKMQLTLNRKIGTQREKEAYRKNEDPLRGLSITDNGFTRIALSRGGEVFETQTKKLSLNGVDYISFRDSAMTAVDFLNAHPELYFVSATAAVYGLYVWHQQIRKISMPSYAERMEQVIYGIGRIKDTTGLFFVHQALTDYTGNVPLSLFPKEDVRRRISEAFQLPYPEVLVLLKGAAQQTPPDWQGQIPALQGWIESLMDALDSKRGAANPDAAMLAPDPSRAQTSPMLKEVDQWQTIPLVVSGVEYQGGINAVLSNFRTGGSVITVQPGGSAVDVSVSLTGNITDDGAKLSFIKLAFEALRDKLLADPNVAGRYDFNVNMEFAPATLQGTKARLTDTVTMTIARKTDAAMKAPGGIDLQRSGANTNVLKEGKGVEFKLDPAMIEKVRREGIQSLTPVILRVEPAVNIGILLGLVP